MTLAPEATFGTGNGFASGAGRQRRGSSGLPSLLAMHLLLLSNSSSDAGYLTHALPWLRETLAGVERAAFIPYAGVTVGWDDYAAKVREALADLDVEIVSVHEVDNPTGLVSEAGAILVGGGNTFQLLRETYRVGLVELVRQRVRAGVPYVGWSAGSNLACPTIMTTNDMPVAEPPTFAAFGLVPFQINPHFTDAHPPGHRGETRRQRLAEFVAANPEMPVVGLPEGTALRVADGAMELLGASGAVVFDPSSPEGRDVAGADLAKSWAARRWRQRRIPEVQGRPPEARCAMECLGAEHAEPSATFPRDAT